MQQYSPTSFGKVAVLMGGWSAERDVSLKSGQAVLAGLRARDIDAWPVDVQSGEALLELVEGGFERVFIALHGRGGEDGVVQGALEALRIPYTGSGVLASALAMDKLRSKQLLQGVGLPTPAFWLLEEDTDANAVIASLDLPLMVKPALEGSSLGMSRVEHAHELSAARETAARFRGPVLAERWIEGPEYTVAILGDEALPVIRLETPHMFYDYQAKYEADTTRYHLPCGLAAEQESRLQRLAKAAFAALGCHGWGRVDLISDAQGHPWIIEVNTVPGMTDHSLVPMAAEAAGLSFADLVVTILAQTLDEHRQGASADGIKEPCHAE